MKGLQSGMVNLHEGEEFEGAQIAWVNVMKPEGGLEHKEARRGVQIGLVNYTDSMKGAQIGLININKSAKLKFFPILNISR